MGLLKIALARRIYAQAKINMSNRREGSKKHALSLSEGSARSCPEQSRRKGRELLARSRRARIALLIP